MQYPTHIGGAAISGAARGYDPQPPRETMTAPAFAIVLENLGNAEASIRDLSDSAAMAATRILGQAPSHRPVNPNVSPEQDRAPSLIGDMNDHLGRIKGLLSCLRDDLNAITAALP